MPRLITFFIAFFSIVNIHAVNIKNIPLNLDNYQEATLHFLDDTSIKGYAKIIDFLGKSKIKFKLSEDGKVDSWDDLMVKGITFHTKLVDIVFYYVNVQHFSEAKLLEVVEVGEIFVYAKSETAWVSDGFLSINFDNVYMFPSAGRGTPHKETTFKFFIKKESEAEAIDLDGVINFKKSAKSYFKNCPGIIEKIDSRKFTRKTILEMVYYYNDFCAEL